MNLLNKLKSMATKKTVAKKTTKRAEVAEVPASKDICTRCNGAGTIMEGHRICPECNGDCFTK